MTLLTLCYVCKKCGNGHACAVYIQMSSEEYKQLSDPEKAGPEPCIFDEEEAQFKFQGAVGPIAAVKA